MIGLSVFQIAVAAAILTGVGYSILCVLWLMLARRALARDLIATLNVATVIFATLIAVFLLGGWVLTVALVLLAARVGYEAAHTRIGSGYAAVFGILSAGVSLGAIWSPAVTTILSLTGAWCLLLGLLLLSRRHLIDRLRGIIEVLLFPVLPMAVLATAALMPWLQAMILVAYILVETFDGYALVSGKIFGRTKAFPTLSPRKTVEGLVGGVAGLMVTAILLALVTGQPVGGAIAIALTGGLFCLAGDLGASRLKRIAGTKDFPVVFKSQGGLFDTFDSWIATGAGLAALSLIWSQI